MVKLVIGTLEGDAEKQVTLHAVALAALTDVARHFPALTHLHLWGLRNLESLGGLPEGLIELDVRKCGVFAGCGAAPGGLRLLVIEECPDFRQVDGGESACLAALEEVSFKGCPALPETVIQRVVGGSLALRFLDLSGTGIKRPLPKDARWPQGIVDLRLNRCARLEFLPAAWPAGLRRLELRGSTKLPSMPPFPAGLDFIDLSGTASLRYLPPLPERLPAAPRRPRTLFLHGSGVRLDPVLYGDTPETNVAPAVLAAQEAAAGGNEPDHELKVILLGNGRCGKTSLVKRLRGLPFDPKEDSTHGIQLWEQEIDFHPVDARDGDEASANLKIWDFAGQDLYHSTHRLFLQSRAIFLICRTDHPDGADPATDENEKQSPFREEDVHRGLDYWLGQVESLGRCGRSGTWRWRSTTITCRRLAASGKTGILGGSTCCWSGPPAWARRIW